MREYLFPSLCHLLSCLSRTIIYIRNESIREKKKEIRVNFITFWFGNKRDLV